MFKFLKNFYKKKQNTENANFLCSVNFQLNHDNTLNITYFWPEFNEKNVHKMEKISNEFGNLLYMINGGYMRKDCIEVLTKLLDDDKNIYDSTFVNLLLIKWLDNLSSETKNNDYYEQPLIKPSSVFKQYK